MAVSIFVHDIGSREIRVKFDVPVVSADNPEAYALATGSSAHVPSILSASYYDADRTSVKLTLSEALTREAAYMIAVSDILSDDGDEVVAAPFPFAASDVDIPKILGAYQSVRGCIDIVCDRDVATTSVSATAHLVATGTVAMTLVPWAAGRPENAVRFSFSSAPSAPSGESRVQFFNIADISQNTAFGTVPLTTAYVATGYSSLVKARIVRALVADVSNARGFATAVIRVFFNCPMSAADVANQSKWEILQGGAHVASDAGNEITAPDATDLGTLCTLANQAKLRLNAHFRSHAHLVVDAASTVSASDAVDLGSAADLLSDEQTNLMAHYERTDSHRYADHLHAFSGSGGELSDAISWANALKSCFNAHLGDAYSVPFSSAYSPLGPIVNFASQSNSAAVADEMTWFADLHAATDAACAPMTVRSIVIRSEDLGSFSSDAVEVEPFACQMSELSVAPRVRGATIRMSGGVEIVDAGFASVRQRGRPVKIVSVRASSSVPVLLWAFNNVLHAYKLHIGNPSLPPRLGAGHPVLDTVNTVSTSNYATTMDLGSLVSKANAFRSKLTAHVTSSAYHYGEDVEINAPEASDLESLIVLIDELRGRLISHNSSGFAANGDIVPAFPMFHDFPGAGIVSAALCDRVVVDVDGFEDGVEAEASVPIAKVWIDNRPNVAVRTVPRSVAARFAGTDTVPVLVSAVARPGVSAAAPSPYLMSDAVELYMSKPMRNTAVVPGVSVSIPGMSLLDGSWLGDKVVSVRVAKMLTASYTVNAVGFRDLAGNLLYEEPIM